MNHWFKKGTAALLTFSMLLGSAFSVNAAPAEKTQEEGLKIACISDTHYLSPDMIKNTADFQTHLNSDRKMFAESDAFLTALLNTIRQDDPDVLLISGDLTKDGEKEGHEAFAKKLNDFRKKEMPDLHIYLAPGNHDLNNPNAYNFNTEDGVAVPATRTTQQDFKDIYADVTYNDETIIATFTPGEGKQGGGLSYAARPKDGFTVISIDSARYSADNTDSGTDIQETSGAIGPDLENWILEQIAAAKKRGDTVIGVQHHGYIPHFGMEPELLPMYLVNDYARLSEEFADAGMQYVFTGHMHANDIASLTTANGNNFYDIETGSVITYPSPARTVTINRTIAQGTVTETMDVKTHLNVSTGDFINPVTNEHQVIDDITAYGKEHGFTNDMLATTVNGFLHTYYEQIAQSGGTKAAVEQLVNDLLGDSLPVGNITLEQLIDIGLPLLLPDGSNGENIYYSGSESGIVVKQKVSVLNLQLVVPTQALKETMNALFSRVDNEVLANPEQLDELVDGLVSELVTLPVAKDGETDKTLLEFANYIYQSHLGGEDNGNHPAWVQETIAKLNDGTLLQDVINVIFRNLTDLLNQSLYNLPCEEVLGSKEFDTTNKCLVSYNGRTPLIRALDDTSANTLGLAFGMLLKWPAGGNGFVMPDGYSTGEMLDTLSPLLGLDIEQLLSDLLLGTPANPDTGEEAAEGLLTEELKGELNTFLVRVIDTMGTDDNYPEDNDTTITYTWNLLTDRTALDQAIADAETIDLTLYTEESAKAVTDALDAARNLPATATQEEMDNAAAALNQAVSSLKPIGEENKPGDGTNVPGGNTNTPGSNTNKPGDKPSSNGNNNHPVKNTGRPITGDSNNVALWITLALISGGSVTLLALNGRRKNHR